MALFLSLLPTDLQILVLNTWIDTDSCGWQLLRALSALDVACGKVHQPSFRSLTSLLLPFGECLSVPSKSGIKYAINYIQWLNSRKVAVKALLLSGYSSDGLEDLNQQAAAPITLASVEQIVWRNNSAVRGPLLEAVLRACPNIQSLQTDDFLDFAPPFVAPLFTPPPKLNAITIIDMDSVDFQSLGVIGPQLLELRMKRCVLSDEQVKLIMEHCPLLQVLEARRINHDIVMDLFWSCKQLKELYLAENFFTEDDITTLLAFEQIKRLTVNVTSFSSTDCNMLVDVMCRFPGTEYLRIGKCVYSSAEGILELAGCELDGALMTQLLNTCPVVKFLTIHDATVRSDGVEVLIQWQVGSGWLTRFTVQPGTSYQLQYNLQTCGPLITCIVLNLFSVSDDMLRAVAAHCPQLEIATVVYSPYESFTLWSDPSKVTDEGMNALFEGCPRIKELTLSHFDGITTKTLQSIAQHKLPLRVLTVQRSKFTLYDVNVFGQLVKEYQLPATLVILEPK